MWLLSQYRRTQQRRLAGLADAVETRLAWDYVRGGLLGPVRWRRALREVAAIAPAPAAAPAPVAIDPPEVPPPPAGDEPLAVSVIVPTHERPQALGRCLDALAAQDAAAGRFEVVVVDDSATASAAIDARHEARLRVRVIHTRGSGAAAARNAGAASAAAPLLLFLDDDVVAEPELVRHHRERHEREDGDAVVVGPYPPRPVTRSLASSAAALWWNDLFLTLEHGAAPTYVSALTGNMSISAAAFTRSGGFDARFGRVRREDWEWGVRVLGAGLPLRYEPTARGIHEYALDARARLNAAELEGHGDALLLRAHPVAASAVLPLATGAMAGGRRRALQRAAWGSPLVRRIALATLAALEWGRLRGTWVRIFNVAQGLSYQRGARAGDATHAEEPLLDVDLDGTDPIPLPSLATPTVRVLVGGREVGRVRPALGQWTPDVAEQILDAIPWTAVEQAAAALGCRPLRDETHDHARQARVLLGPAHAPSDAAEGAQLAAAGAEVVTVAGDVNAHWQAIADAPLGDAALVALTLPGVRPDRRWLDEALVAFDGERVGAVLGCGLPDDAPPSPLVLHARSERADDLRLDAVTTPHYLVLRRELIPLLAAEAAGGGLLAPVHGFVEQLLDSGWVVGYRDVHGLAGEGPSRFDGARALAEVRMRRSRRPGATALDELRRTTLVTAWHVARGDDRRAAAETYAGALAGLLSARRNAASRR